MPNFYILIVAPPGEAKKSTSTSLGMSMLAEIGADMGPEVSTWQALITHMAANQKLTKVGHDEVQMTCTTLELSEFGSFFDSQDRSLIDILVRLWDNKPGPLLKETKKDGCETIANPWLNILAATTPDWIASNFTEMMVGGGLASRMLYVHVDKSSQDIPYPSRNPTKVDWKARVSLVARLKEISELSGQFKLTEEAFEWGDKWYHESKARMRASESKIENSFFVREQTQLHKLAMIVSVSRGHFPSITLEDLQEADSRLKELSGDVKRVFNVVGQTPVTKTAADIVEALVKNGPVSTMTLYRRQFMRTKSVKDYFESLNCVVRGGLVCSYGDTVDPMLKVI